MNILSLLGLSALPSSVTALCFWWIKKQIDKNESVREMRERAMKENEYLLVKSVGAAIALGEATAHAMQLGHTNGDMETALEYAKAVKHEQKEFLQRQAVHNIY